MNAASEEDFVEWC